MTNTEIGYLGLIARFNPDTARKEYIRTEHLGELLIVGYEDYSGNEIDPTETRDYRIVCKPVGGNVHPVIKELISSDYWRKDGNLVVGRELVQYHIENQSRN